MRAGLKAKGGKLCVFFAAHQMLELSAFLAAVMVGIGLFAGDTDTYWRPWPRNCPHCDHRGDMQFSLPRLHVTIRDSLALSQTR